MTTGQDGAITLLAQLMAGIRGNVGADAIQSTRHGVSAVLVLESGDRYTVTVNWEGDAEGAPAA